MHPPIPIDTGYSQFTKLLDAQNSTGSSVRACQQLVTTHGLGATSYAETTPTRPVGHSFLACGYAVLCREIPYGDMPALMPKVDVVHVRWQNSTQCDRTEVPIW